MATEQDNPSEEDEALARHRALVEAGEGQRPMTWSDWAALIHESKSLTPEGKRIAFWAAETLQQSLKEDFFQKVAAWQAKMQAQGDLDLAPQSHPIFSIAWWPAANDAPLVYANLIRLAAQIHLFMPDQKNRHEGVLGKLREHPDPIKWWGTLVQFEVAALGVMAGWEILLEPVYRTGKKADVRLIRSSTEVYVEVRILNMSNKERKALAFYHNLASQLYMLGSWYGVHIPGKVSLALLEQDGLITQWFQQVEEAVKATAEDGQERPVPGPKGVLVTVIRPTEETMGEPWEIAGEPVVAYFQERLVNILDEKNTQAKDSLVSVWVRIDDFAGVWECTRWQGWTLAQTFAYFTDFVRQKLPAFPYLSGVMLSSGLLLSGNAPPELLFEQVEYHGALALCRLVPVSYYREMLIIPRAGLPNTERNVFADLYRKEPTWLDRALKHLGHPPFHKLVQVERGADSC